MPRIKFFHFPLRERVASPQGRTSRVRGCAPVHTHPLTRFAPRTTLSHKGRGINRGVVLVVVLVVIALLSLAGYTFSELMMSEHEAALAHGKALQARALCDSGAAAVQSLLMLSAEDLQTAGGCYDNPDRLRGMVVCDDGTPGHRGHFTIVAPKIEDGVYAGLRYGLEDESTRLNLNTLVEVDKQSAGMGRKLLKTLPGMTDEIADAILDWMDEDSEARELGAEIDEYSGRDPPYAPKNGPLDSVEELLLVRGVTPALLFGLDTNRNGSVDTHEQQGALPDGVDNSDGSFDRGWSGLLTLFSQEPNVNSQGKQRVNVNGDDMQQLHADLAEAVGLEWATYIVAYRQNGPNTGPTNNAVPIGGKSLDLSKPGQTKLQTVLDLIDTSVSVKFLGDQQASVIRSPFTSDRFAMGGYLPKMMDNLTVNGAKAIPGRININQAPRSLMLGIPGLDEVLVERIIAERLPEAETLTRGRQYETWLLAEGLVNLQQMKGLMPFITGRGGVYRAQIVGYFDGGGPAVRVEAIFDTSGGLGRLLFWRDMSHLGRGYPLETLGVMVVQ